MMGVDYKDFTLECGFSLFLVLCFVLQVNKIHFDAYIEINTDPLERNQVLLRFIEPDFEN